MTALISISEIQQMLKVSRSTVYRLINRGEIGCVHIGRIVRIPASDVDAYLQRLRHVTQHSEIV
jgi:excisionase family DNA binding protein